ncbi:MAG: 4Fe-4S dicluster domain-containing protein [Candidatus Sigynarchaeota archaeon]
MEIIKIKYEKDEIVDKHSTSEICYKCSACSKFCPITLHVPAYNLENSFVVHLYRAEREKALRDVWMCCSCEKCFNICPQDGDPAHVFVNLKEASYKEGFAPESVYGLVNQLLNTGSAYVVSVSTNKGREKLGLKEIKANEGVIADLKKLAARTDLKVKGGSNA